MVDHTVIGAGIVGLATAYQLTEKNASARVLVLEKEDDIAKHQSGNNSGVIHSGIYYKPGSLKATNCRAGKELLGQFARENDIAYEICGKVIVACDEVEELRLKDLFERGKQNGVKVEWLNASGLRELEPHVQGISAVHVPEAGIIDYPAMCRMLASHIAAAGGEIRTGARVNAIRRSSDSILLELEGDTVETGSVINCAGLYSDALAKQSGEQLQHQIVPFRGEYYELVPEARSLVNNLIYPVPDPRFPFLGVHFTRMISGTVECGPNAVLGLAREGYSWKAFNSAELFEVLRYPGFWQLVRKYPFEGASEMLGSLSKRAFLKALNRLIPDLRMQDITPHGAGVRAQAVMKDGSMLDDFLFAGSDGITHVLNAPSPGATASLAIAKAVVAKHTGDGS